MCVVVVRKKMEEREEMEKIVTLSSFLISSLVALSEMKIRLKAYFTWAWPILI